MNATSKTEKDYKLLGAASVIIEHLLKEAEKTAEKPEPVVLQMAREWLEDYK